MHCQIVHLCNPRNWTCQRFRGQGGVFQRKENLEQFPFVWAKRRGGGESLTPEIQQTSMLFLSVGPNWRALCLKLDMLVCSSFLRWFWQCKNSNRWMDTFLFSVQINHFSRANSHHYFECGLFCTKYGSEGLFIVPRLGVVSLGFCGIHSDDMLSILGWARNL